MSYAAERAAIETRFSTLWAGTPIGDVVFDNLPYTPVQGTPYVRLSIKPGTSERITIGTREHRVVGLILVQIFVPTGSGTNAARVLADEAAEIFRDQEFDGVLCRSPSIQNVGQSGDWAQFNVSVPYKRDEVFA